MNFRFTLSHDLNATINSLPSWEDIGPGATEWSINGMLQAQVTKGAFGVSNFFADDIINPFIGTYQFLFSAEGSVNGAGGNTAQLTIHLLDADQNVLESSSSITIPNAGLTNQPVSIAISEPPKYVAFRVNNLTGSSNTITVTAFTIANSATSQVISEPDGWKEAKIFLERDMNFFSLLERYEGGAGGAFIFYGLDERGIDGGYHFIKGIEEVYGPDADITFKAEYAPNDTDYETIFEGLLDLAESETRPDNRIQVPVVRDDFWRKFITRMETPVNLSSTEDLDGNPVEPLQPITLNLPSQKIRKRYRSTMTDSVCYGSLTSSQYAQVDWDTVELSELEEKYALLQTVNDEQPQSIFIAKEGGLYTFDIKIIFTRPQSIEELVGEVTVFDFTWENLSGFLNMYIAGPDGVGLGFTRTDQSSGSMNWSEYTYNGQLELKEGDSVTIWGDAIEDFTSGNMQSQLILIGSDVSETALCSMPDFFNSSFTVSGLESYLDITADTTFQQTEAEGYLIHDAIYGVLERYGLRIGRDHPLYSEFLGSTSTITRQYDGDGCGWMYAIVKGLQIRQYTIEEKPFFISFKQIWDGINPILNLGLGYEIVDDEQVIRIEQKDHFLTQDISLTITNVRDISYTYDNELIFKTIKTGFKKWESEDILGIDDPQTKHTYATRFKKIGKELNLESEFIAAGLAIETTRRKTKEKSADYKFDNDTFIIAIREDDVSPNRYTPELDENFDSVSGVLNSDSRYNLILTPMRTLLRWANYIGGCLQQYATSAYKFVSGEGNYDMASDYSCGSGNQCQAIICDELSEKQDISLADYNGVFGFYFLPLLYEIRVPLTWDNMNAIRDNRKKAIRISQTESNLQPFKIKELEYDLLKGQVVIRAWPIAYFPIQVIDQNFNQEPEQSTNFDEDYQEFIDYIIDQGYTPPSEEVQIIQNELIEGLKEEGVFQELDLLYIFATDGDEDVACLNIINPTQFKAQPVNDPVFTTNEGYEGNLTDAYINTGWAPATDAVAYTQNDAGAFCYINNESTANFGTGFGMSGSPNGQLAFTPKTSGGSVVHAFGVNSAGDTVGTNPVSSIGFFHLQRTLSNKQELFKNGTSVDDSTQLSGSLSSNELYLLCINNDGTPGSFTDIKISVFGIGASLSGKEAALYNAINTYLTALAAIVPEPIVNHIIQENGDEILTQDRDNILTED